MRSWVLATGLLAAAGTTSAIAADLDDGPPYDRRGAYDDPRYADIYKHPVPPPPPYAAPLPPRGPAYREEYDDYGRGRYPLAQNCVPRGEVRERLHRAGWHDLEALDVQGGVANIQARRPSGRLFSITLDRCSGEIISAVPLEPRRWGGGYGPRPYEYGYGQRYYGPYADGPRRRDRPFY